MPTEALGLDFVFDESSDLDERSQRILALERQWWKYAGAKEQAITQLFSISATNYYQLLNTLIDTDAALAYDPMLVNRLRRLRTTRHRARPVKKVDSGS